MPLRRFMVHRTLPGGYYRPHHDYNAIDLLSPRGPMLWTYLIYCSDVAPGQGGETIFPSLNLSVRPRTGLALAWPNAFKHTLFPDLRTRHEGTTLKAGAKYAIHVHIRPGASDGVGEAGSSETYSYRSTFLMWLEQRLR